ncbi:MAG: FHA domain-containing protein, partial [Pirellulaceae bacterium]|nr:FHA domain-containing protein [Pirellulaceae bacterium]
RSAAAENHFDDDHMSSIHFEVANFGDRAEVRDLRSTNKTWLNNAQVSTSPLKHGDRLRAGKTIMGVELEYAAEVAQSHPSPLPVQESHNQGAISASKAVKSSLPPQEPHVPEPPKMQPAPMVLERRPHMVDDFSHDAPHARSVNPAFVSASEARSAAPTYGSADPNPAPMPPLPQSNNHGHSSAVPPNAPPNIGPPASPVPLAAPPITSGPLRSGPVVSAQVVSAQVVSAQGWSAPGASSPVVARPVAATPIAPGSLSGAPMSAPAPSVSKGPSRDSAAHKPPAAPSTFPSPFPPAAPTFSPKAPAPVPPVAPPNPLGPLSSPGPSGRQMLNDASPVYPSRGSSPIDSVSIDAFGDVVPPATNARAAQYAERANSSPIIDTSSSFYGPEMAASGDKRRFRLFERVGDFQKLYNLRIVIDALQSKRTLRIVTHFAKIRTAPPMLSNIVPLYPEYPGALTHFPISMSHQDWETPTVQSVAMRLCSHDAIMVFISEFNTDLDAALMAVGADGVPGLCEAGGFFGWCWPSAFLSLMQMHGTQKWSEILGHVIEGAIMYSPMHSEVLLAFAAESLEAELKALGFSHTL